MKKINENTKVTLTFKQLKKLVGEAVQAEPQGQYFRCKKGEYSIHVYVPASGTKVHNKLEDSDYTTSEKKPFVLVGTVGEEWTVNADKLKKEYLYEGKPITDEVLEMFKGDFYKKEEPKQEEPENADKEDADTVEVSEDDARVQQYEISTNPASNVVTWCKFVPVSVQCVVNTSWGEALTANRGGVPHGKGDYIMAADDGGKPNMNDRWVVNGEIFPKTYVMIDKVQEGLFGKIKDKISGKKEPQYLIPQKDKYEPQDIKAAEEHIKEIFEKIPEKYGFSVNIGMHTYDRYLNYNDYVKHGLNIPEDLFSMTIKKMDSKYREDSIDWSDIKVQKKEQPGQQPAQQQTPAVSESTKVTLTFGQLKKLVKESVTEPMKVPAGFIKHLLKCGAARELGQDEYNGMGPFDTIAYSMGTYGMSAKLVHKSRNPEELFVVDSSKVNF